MGGFELCNGGEETLTGTRIAKTVLGRKTGYSLREHTLAAAYVDDFSQTLAIADGDLLEEVRTQSEATNDHESRNVIGSKRARGKRTGFVQRCLQRLGRHGMTRLVTGPS
jgi:hypothetical protein